MVTGCGSVMTGIGNIIVYILQALRLKLFTDHENIFAIR